MSGEEYGSKSSANNQGKPIDDDEDTGSYEDKATRQVSGDALAEIRESAQNEAAPAWLKKVVERERKAKEEADALAESSSSTGINLPKPQRDWGDEMLGDPASDTSEMGDAATKAVERGSLSNIFDAPGDEDEQEDAPQKKAPAPASGILSGRKLTGSKAGAKDTSNDFDDFDFDFDEDEDEAPQSAPEPEGSDEPDALLGEKGDLDALEEVDDAEQRDDLGELDEYEELDDFAELDDLEELDALEDLEELKAHDAAGKPQAASDVLEPPSLPETETPKKSSSSGILPVMLVFLALGAFAAAAFSLVSAAEPALTDPLVFGPVAAGVVMLMIAVGVRR